MILSGVNNHQGGTTLKEGALRIASDSNLGRSSAPLTFDGGTLHTPLSLSIDRPISLASSGAIDVDKGVAVSIDQPLTGGGSLSKEGGGTLELVRVNTYTGQMIVADGTVQVKGGATLGNGAGLKLEAQGKCVIEAGARTKSVKSLDGSGLGIDLHDNTLEVESGTFSGKIAGSSESSKRLETARSP